MRDWDEVVAFALTLPDTELGSSYGRPALRVGGRSFLYTGREEGSFAVHSPMDEKEVLIETDPDTFWQSDHYRRWPAVLVRYESQDRERVERVIARAWWDKAGKAQRKLYGERP